MLRESDGEKEILLGNKQLLGIFFLVVILIGVAFAGGYKLGQGAHKTATIPEETAAASTSTASGETHAVTPDGSNTAATSATVGGTDTAASPTTETPVENRAASRTSGDTSSSEPAPLGARTKGEPTKTVAPSGPEAPGPEAAGAHSGYTPQPGQTFLQVTAVQRDEAEGISEVLRKKGFRAHAVPKAGTKLYRVIIGPMRDASDLNKTRAELRNTGFREIFVQRY